MSEQQQRPTRRQWLRLTAGATVAACGGATTGARIFRPEDFGARGDGRSNDSAAFASLSAAVNRAGGGVVELRPVVYIVGRQHRSDDPALGYMIPDDLLHFVGCERDVVVNGNGATLRAAPGLLYGAFDRSTGRPLAVRLPFLDHGAKAAPYHAMIHAERCRGAVRIAKLTLDGQTAALSIGGKWGDQGWQIAGSGLLLTDNRGDEIVEDVVSHDHPLDGIIVDGLSAADAPVRTVQRRFSRVTADCNGRQGCSIVGGSGYVFEACRFTRTGRGPIASSPGAGVDIEPENGKTIAGLRFLSCTFADNAGCGLVADGGPSANVTFVASTFVGTTSWAAWPKAPHYAFTGCTFVGALANCYGSDDPGAAARFTACVFRDRAARGPVSPVYLAGGPDGWIIDLSTSVNVRFSGCRFELTGRGRLPWSTGAIYDGCTMRQVAKGQAFPRGTWRGRSAITGNVDLAGSRILGTLTVNGRVVPR